MTNIIERTIETLGFALLIAAAVGFWYVTPANAYYDGERWCEVQSDGNGHSYYVCHN